MHLRHKLKKPQLTEGLDEVRKDLTPLSYLQWAKQWQQQGASIIGGCCGIGPEHIATLNQHFASFITLIISLHVSSKMKENKIGLVAPTALVFSK
ncbi:homocysteine S-methyltransferase family protein [Pseudoalteromonas sp. Hal099]